ncbi:helix-turn-helix domain-containing protein, partial [Saccharothrix xinjiangensis]
MSKRRKAFAARREAMGFTQETLAAAVGVEFSTVGRWECGDLTPQPYRHASIARALGLSLEELNALLLSTSPDPVNVVGAVGSDAAEDVRRSQLEWLRVRGASGVRGRELAELAAWLYPRDQRGPGGHVLTGPGWLLDEPVELDSVRLVLSDAGHPTPAVGPMDHVLPLTARGERYSSYSRAVRDLVRPRLLENRLSYRLLEVSRHDGLALTFGTTTFFEVFDVKEAFAHEFKAAWLASGGSVPGWDA